MKLMNLLVIAAMILVLTGCEVFHSDSRSSAGYSPPAPPPPPASRPAPAPPSHPRHEPGVNVSITASERQLIQGYVNSFMEEERHPGKGKGKGKAKGKQPKSLPPGLQKKLDRGGSLPPGWERKMRQGEVVPAEIYSQCHPLPQEVVVQLPPQPPGTIMIAIGGKVARLLAATHEILDIFEVEH